MIKLNYGKYSIPKYLDKLITLEKQLNQDGLLNYVGLLGYYFSYEGIDSRYLNTPLDLISFARPGVDGIHYGFLTDFGQVKNLETAYIVRISPMDFDDPVKIVARNMGDFLRIIGFFPGILDVVDIHTSESDIEMALKETSTFHLHHKVRDIFLETMQLKPIEHLYDYLQKIKHERENEIVLSTEDGIGVVNKGILDEEELKKISYSFNEGQSLEMKEVKHFFDHAPYSSKLAFLRDSQSKGLIFDNQEVKFYLKEQLNLMQLHDEAIRMAYPE